MSLIPEGTYPAKATGEYEFGIAESSGNEQIGVAFRITAGDYAGRVLTWYGFFNTDDNAKRALKALRACGWKGDNLAELSGITEQEVSIVVEIDNYDPQNLRNKVAWVNGGGVAMKNVMDERQKKALAARMKGLILATGGGQKPAQRSEPRSERSYGGTPGRAPAPQQQRREPDHDYDPGSYDSDIPF